jgi:molybdopterin molybdotransferase
MLSFDEARGRLLGGVVRLPHEHVALEDASGRVLAEDLRAEHGLPPFDHSAMDGYALRVADLGHWSAWTLPVVGESAAGKPSEALASGAACRIFTGAELPRGADAVVMQEDVIADVGRITLRARPKLGQHIRRAGEDLAAGSLAMHAGSRISAVALALAAMLDRPLLVVSRRPRVTILCTGDELRTPGQPARRGSISESNSVALAALARQAGAMVRVASRVGDNIDALRRAVEQALNDTDVLVTVGGVSVGVHDVVKPALEQAGVTMDFWKVAIKPGKPLAVGSIGATHVLGLPGNPASALVTFVLFGMPLLRALQGDTHPFAPALPATIASARKRSVDRVEFVRARLRTGDGILIVEAHDNQASGSAINLADSDGLAIVMPGEAPLREGSIVDFLRWNDA